MYHAQYLILIQYLYIQNFQLHGASLVSSSVLFIGPTYYPLYPVSTVEDPLEATPSHVIPSPMAPLEPPWPLLPPLETRGKKKKGGGGGGGSLNASLNSVNFRHFLAAQEKAFFVTENLCCKEKPQSNDWLYE